MSDYKVNEATIAKKAELVDVYAQKMTEAASIVVADSRGLSVDQDTQLRKQLREAGVEFKVVKNSVLRRAAEKAGLEGLSEAFSGPSAVAFSNEDVVAPAKVLADFAKVKFLLKKKSKLLRLFQAATVFFLCFFQCFKHLSATWLLQSKLLQKKKNQLLNYKQHYLYRRIYATN